MSGTVSNIFKGTAGVPTKKGSSRLRRKLTYMAVNVTRSDQKKIQNCTEGDNYFTGIINIKQLEPYHVLPLIHFLAVQPANYQFRATTKILL